MPMGPLADPVLVVHGGAGPRRADGDGRAAACRRDIVLALDAGWKALADGAEAACLAAVCVLEDSPHFNAGTGSALAADGGVWCDATLVCGDGRAGAVAAVRGIRNPILAARALAHDDGGPLLWSGRSEELAERHAIELVDPEAMVTERQRRRLAAHRAGGRAPRGGGTVGAVCLDRAGRLAAATSTGGVCGKPPARLGDSAIVGAGTWAHADTCAVSATGDGEPFMRVLFAHDVHCRMAYGGEGLAAAASAALEAVRAAGGLGGAIAVDARGAIAMPVTSEIMHRGWRRAGEPAQTAVAALSENGGGRAAPLDPGPR
jgi:L-asparaginase / beta-aspartyl-peptidase